MAALALGLAACVGASTNPAEGAAGNVSIAFQVASHSQLAGCAPGPAINFGIVLPGTTAAPNSDCTVTFGSSNDTSMLRMWQTDGIGSAMYAVTSGKLDQGWDNTVSGNGQFTISGATPLGWDTSRPGVVTQAGTGKVVAAYLRSGQDLDVVRFNENGTLDNTFGSSGRFSDASSNWAQVGQPAALRDGSIVVVSRDGWSPYDWIAIKLQPNGTLDPTFDGPSGTADGHVVLPEFGAGDTWGVIELADGDLFAYGTTHNGSYYMGAATRLNADGTFDTAFGGGDGFATYDLGNHTYFYDAVEQPDGRVVIVGNEWAGDQDFVVARVNRDGTLDAAFDGPGTGAGGNGLFDIPGVASQNEGATGVVLAPDGDIVIAGGTAAGGEDVYLMRLQQATGAFEPTWDGPTGTGNGRVRHTLTANADWGDDILIAPSGELIVAGTTSPGGVGYEPMVMKVRDDGTLDTTFDGDSGTANGVVRVTASATDDEVYHATLASDGDVVLVGTTDAATDLLRLTRFDGITMADYDDDDLAPADQNWSEGTGFFGVCLRALTGTGAAATWSAHATCAQDDTGTHWRSVPLASGASKVGQVGAGALDGTASFRFATRVPSTQLPGAYVAPVTFEVVAPAA